MTAYKVPRSLSPSAMATYEQCPKKYQFQKLDKIPPDGTSEALILGRLVHEVLERLLKGDPETRTRDRAREILRDFWAGSKNYQRQWKQSVKKQSEDEGDFKWNVWWCLESYFSLEDPQEIEADGHETRISGTIGDVPIYGVIDRWHDTPGGLVIVDYKTGKIPDPRWGDKDRTQALIYALAMMSKHPDKEFDRADLMYVKHSQVKSHRMDESDREEVVSQVSGVWADIKSRCETGEFEPIKQRLCDWCEYRTICPVWA